jgi:hypothetical protein
MKDEKHTVLVVTEKELDIIYLLLDTAADELICDLNDGLTSMGAFILDREHDVITALLSKINKDKERRLENEA